MIISYILLALIILFASHLIFLPLSKRRPIILKDIEGSVFIVIFIFFIATIFHPVIYLIAVAFGLFIYFTKCWIISGVSLENVKNALEKSILATRATNIKDGNIYKIDDSMLIRITNLGIRTTYIQFNSQTFSKKSELTKDIFRKFIQNYFI